MDENSNEPIEPGNSGLTYSQGEPHTYGDPGLPGGSKRARGSKPKSAAFLGAGIIGVMVVGMLAMFIAPECERDALLKSGVQAEGTILDIKPTGNTFNDQPQVKLTLEVRPKDADKYTATTKMIINPVYMPQFQPGKKVLVRYDAENPSKVAVEATENGAGF